MLFAQLQGGQFLSRVIQSHHHGSNIIRSRRDHGQAANVRLGGI